jgi:hypothetical protein
MLASFIKIWGKVISRLFSNCCFWGSIVGISGGTEVGSAVGAAGGIAVGAGMAVAVGIGVGGTGIGTAFQTKSSGEAPHPG